MRLFLSCRDKGKLDLGQIKSPRMRKRLLANMKEDEDGEGYGSNRPTSESPSSIDAPSPALYNDRSITPEPSNQMMTINRGEPMKAKVFKLPQPPKIDFTKELLEKHKNMQIPAYITSTNDSSVDSEQNSITLQPQLVENHLKPTYSTTNYQTKLDSIDPIYYSSNAYPSPVHSQPNETNVNPVNNYSSNVYSSGYNQPIIKPTNYYSPNNPSNTYPSNNQHANTAPRSVYPVYAARPSNPMSPVELEALVDDEIIGLHNALHGSNKPAPDYSSMAVQNMHPLRNVKPASADVFSKYQNIDRGYLSGQEEYSSPYRGEPEYRYDRSQSYDPFDKLNLESGSGKTVKTIPVYYEGNNNMINNNNNNYYDRAVHSANQSYPAQKSTSESNYNQPEASFREYFNVQPPSKINLLQSNNQAAYSEPSRRPFLGPSLGEQWAEKRGQNQYKSYVS